MWKVEANVKERIETLKPGTAVRVKGVDGLLEDLDVVAYVESRNANTGTIYLTGNDQLGDAGRIDLWEHAGPDAVDGVTFLATNAGCKVEVEIYDADFIVVVRDNMAHNRRIMMDKNRPLSGPGAGIMHRPTAPDVAELEWFDFSGWTAFNRGIRTVVLEEDAGIEWATTDVRGNL